MSHNRSRTWLARGGAAIVVIVLGFLFWSQLYNTKTSSKEKEVQLLLTEGLKSLAVDDLGSARTYFQKGIDISMDPEERGSFETLLASTYLNTDFKKSAQLYLSVLNNPSYSPRTTSLAGVYLLIGMSNHYDAAVVDEVFSTAPFKGMLENGFTGMTGYEVAIMSGHEEMLKRYPNFLSHLIVGEYYARKYSSAPEKYKKQFEILIPDYYVAGMREFAEAKEDPFWDKTRIAIGYAYGARFAGKFQDLIQTKTITSPEGLSLTQKDADTFFTEAISFTNSLPGGSFRAYTTLTLQLDYASFLANSPVRDVEKIAGLADSLADTISKGADTSSVIKNLQQSQSPGAVWYKSVLTLLASEYSLKLKSAL